MSRSLLARPDSSHQERTMTSKPILTAALLLLAACGETPDTLGPAVGNTATTGQFSATAAGQHNEILALIDAQSAAWAAKDGNAYGATYTVDAEVINPVGGFLVGRALIASQHNFLFNPVNGPFRASTSSWAVRDIAFITGTAALVKLDVTLTGFSALPPGLPAVEPGVVRNRVTWLAVKEGSQWLIAFQQMTPLPPM
jgi:uncharacterized protein (TIGR02246 family)